MKEGMDCLRENLGILKAEMFVAEIIRNNFDYTEWQRTYFDAMTTDEIKQDIDEFVKRFLEFFSNSGSRLLLSPIKTADTTAASSKYIFW